MYDDTAEGDLQTAQDARVDAEGIDSENFTLDDVAKMFDDNIELEPGVDLETKTGNYQPTGEEADSIGASLANTLNALEQQIIDLLTETDMQEMAIKVLAGQLEVVNNELTQTKRTLRCIRKANSILREREELAQLRLSRVPRFIRHLFSIDYVELSDSDKAYYTNQRAFIDELDS